MRIFTAALLILSLGQGGCAGDGAKPKMTVKSIRPASITIAPESHWQGAPTARSMPVFTDLDNVIEVFPAALKGTIIIQRSGRDEGSAGYLQGLVTVPAEATLYVALLQQADEDVLLRDGQFTEFMKEGWQRVPGLFNITEPPGHHMRWSVWSHRIEEGPVTLTSKAIPDGGIFFIGKVK